MKNIKTVVEDIYGLFDKEIQIKEEDAKTFGQQLGEMLVRRLSDRREKPSVRLSNAGKPCGRQLWYTVNTPQLGEKLSAPTRIKFLLGDISELLVLFLAKLAGHSVTDEQRTVTVNGVDGHIDGLIDGELTDVKSASPYSFEKFKSGLKPEEDAFGYLTQVGSYNRGVGGKRFHFLALHKVLGHLHLDTHEDNGEDYDKIIAEAVSCVALPAPPPRAYTDVPDGKSGNYKLGVGCSYCAFRETCWPGLRTVPYANGLRYLTRVVREPNLRGSQ